MGTPQGEEKEKGKGFIWKNMDFQIQRIPIKITK